MWWWLGESLFALAPDGVTDPGEIREGSFALLNEEAVARLRQEEDEVIARAEAKEAERRRQERLAWAKSTLASDAAATPRTGIPRDIRVAVWERDGGQCVECGSTRLLQFDHVIPLAMGGSNSIGNLQLLCDECNRRKGGTLG